MKLSYVCVCFCISEIQEQWAPREGAGGISEPKPNFVGIMDVPNTEAALPGWYTKVSRCSSPRLVKAQQLTVVCRQVPSGQ